MRASGVSRLTSQACGNALQAAVPARHTSPRKLAVTTSSADMRGTAPTGDPKKLLAEYLASGIDTFVLSGYRGLGDAYHVAELQFPDLPLRQPPGPEAHAGHQC